jgi:hypothetical protein
LNIFWDIYIPPIQNNDELSVINNSIATENFLKPYTPAGFESTIFCFDADPMTAAPCRAAPRLGSIED